MSTTLLSVLLGIGGMFGWGMYDFLGGVFAKQIGPFKSFFWSQLAGLISVLLLAFVFTIRLNIPVHFAPNCGNSLFCRIFVFLQRF
jgi:drug/metabolite transporter (DMT)-like permease